MHPKTLRLVALLVSCCWFISSGCDRSADAPKEAVDNPATPTATPTAKLETAQAEPPPAPTLDRDQKMKRAMALIRDGKIDEATAGLRELLIADPNDAEVLFRMAHLKADTGDYRSAIEMLGSIPVEHPEAGLPALGQAADWCMSLEQYDQAETKYRMVLQLAGDVAVAHRQLAYLYNRQGRRHEAAVHLRALCRMGNIQQDELHALMVLGHAILDDPNQPATGPRPYYPIGPAAEARMLYTANRHVEAVEALDESVRSGTASPSIVAFYGLLAMEAQDLERFQWWLNNADQSVQQFGEYWAAIGAYLVSERRFEEAIRALGEALVRDPTNIGAMRRMHQSLTALGQPEQADLWMDRYRIQREVTLASNEIGQSETPAPDSYRKVADGLDQLKRPLEAMTWRMFEAFQRKATPAEMETFNQRRSALFDSEKAFPNRNDRLCGIDLDQYPLPDIELTEAANAASLSQAEQIKTFAPAKFKNVADEVGLDHTYQVASQAVPYRFALYQSLGGGIAALDYDLDGVIDVHLAQGNGDPPSMVGELSNILYRNVDGRLVNVTESAGVQDTRYSVGLTTGDWNQDGFSDLVVANIGNKVLLINNGDGTFRRQVFDPDTEHKILTSSVAMGDLTGDSLPDLYSLQYVEDIEMLDRPKVNEQGNILTVSPSSFQPGIDSIAVNDGSGNMLHQSISDSSDDASTGLGVVIADWDGKPGNEIFVGNDIRANQLWRRSSDNNNWIDIAAVSGCALGVGGVETASMGIAVADFDGNGQRDIHITNFYQEPVSLFMNRGGIFQDRCVQYRLHRDSAAVLGFGCQALDYNLDGRPDLAVTNGNIEKAPGEPLEQSPQLFVNLGDQFQLLDVEDSSAYWQGEYLGRGMAKLDFNLDGKQDLLITHLGSPTALMENQTETDHHWLSVQLVGVESERDAIGAQVDVYAGERSWTNWIVGGDGYLCRNEPVVFFGLADTTSVDRVVVTWPNGQQQTYTEIPTDRRILLIQNDPQAFLHLTTSLAK